MIYPNGFTERRYSYESDCDNNQGEARHHEAIDAKAAGISLIVAGHFATEFPLMPVLGDKLKRRFPELRVLVSKRCRDPFTYLG